MEGHRSVVSSLVVSEGALYSGSWDGTIRLWCLSDHSPLTVLGENIPGKVSSILSVKIEKDLLVAVHENGTIKVLVILRTLLDVSFSCQRGKKIRAPCTNQKELTQGRVVTMQRAHYMAIVPLGCNLESKPMETTLTRHVGVCFLYIFAGLEKRSAC